MDCGFPGVIRNGYVIGSSFSFDNRVRYRCNQGYRVVGNITRYCNELGYWESSAPICEGITVNMYSMSLDYEIYI